MILLSEATTAIPLDMYGLLHNLLILVLGGNATIFIGSIHFVYKKYKTYSKSIKQFNFEHELLMREYRKNHPTVVLHKRYDEPKESDQD